MLDELIFKLETNLGKQHTTSPFTGLYNKYGFSTMNNNSHNDVVQPAAPVKEEVKKEEKPVANVSGEEKKQQQPKKE